MIVMIFRGLRFGLLMSILGGTITGCGVVYTPQEFEESVLTYGYKGDFGVAIDVVPLTFSSARSANADGYLPKTLPEVFSEVPISPNLNISTRERMKASGVYDIVSPLILTLPPVPTSYEGDREVIPPATRSEILQPYPVPEPLYLPLPEPSHGGNLEPQTSSSLLPPISVPYVSSNWTVAYNVESREPVTSQVHGVSSVSSLSGNDFLSGSGRMGRETAFFSSNVDLDVLLERPQLRQSTSYNPLPYTEPRPYRIGPGDIIGLQMRANALPASNRERNSAIVPEQTVQQLLVQGNGEIFVPQAGAISVGGLTLPEARRVINDRLLASRLGFDPVVQIVEFGSKNVSISGLNDAKVIPITVRHITLGEAVVSVGGLGSKPENVVVRVLRDGEIYEMNGDRILDSGALAARLLVDGDLVVITSSYDPEGAVTYFNQQLQLREIARSNFTDKLASSQEQRAQEAAERAVAQFNFDRDRFELQEERAQTAEKRAEEGLLLDRTRLSLNLRSQRLEEDRQRRDAEIARLQLQREIESSNEEARIANIKARQEYLDQLRILEELNRQTLRDVRQETRDVMSFNQSERIRARSDLLAVMELELQQDSVRLGALSDQRQELRDVFNEKIKLGAIEQDYITIAGETRNQTAIPLPFGRNLNLARALYEKTNGIDPLSGDTSEIYVFRTPSQNRVQDRMIAFHLNASNPAALAVASIFEMRPNDVIYVNPQPITKWNRVLTQILPSTGLLRSGISAISGVTN